MKKSLRPCCHKECFAITLSLALISPKRTKPYTAVLGKIKNARALDRIPFIDNTKQDVVLKAMIKDFGGELVSLGPVLVRLSWCMRITEPRIGSGHPDGVI